MQKIVHRGPSHALRRWIVLLWLIVLSSDNGLAQPGSATLSLPSQAIDTAPDHEVLIAFNLSPAVPQMPNAGKEDKGIAVYDHLLREARIQQAEVVEYLQEQGASFRTFSVVNAVWARLRTDQIGHIAGMPGVTRITRNTPLMMEQPAHPVELLHSNGIEWGLQRIGADSVWAMGITGQGVVVAGGDTGYDWRHPALHTRYLGTMEDTVDHNYHWHDAIHAISPLHMDSIVAPENNPCGLDVREPCDDNGHGTHTMGTMVGRAGMDTIGVAPGARWIACRNMERGYGSPASYIECFEWFLAPTDLDGNKPDPARAPHVINNSWSCPPMEGCHPGNFELIRAAIGNLRAAGIVVVTSAGNAGPDCNTINRPPGMFAESFVVGATNINDTIADFSSRGAVQVDSSGRIKPDVVAPGVGVRSAWLDSNYIFANGTSMAGPHVAGTVALIISANPDLAGQVGVIEDIIRSTAIPLVTTQVCDSLSDQDVPNNTYGYGRINALAAVRKALTLSSVRQPPAVEQLQVFPNPARDDISVRTTSGKPCSGLSLVSITGQVIRVIPKSACADFVSIAELPPGMYFLTGEHAGRAFSARFVKM